MHPYPNTSVQDDSETNKTIYLAPNGLVLSAACLTKKTKEKEIKGKKHPPLMYLYRMSLWSFMECSFGYHSINPDLGGIDRTGWNKQVHEPSLLIL